MTGPDTPPDDTPDKVGSQHDGERSGGEGPEAWGLPRDERRHDEAPPTGSGGTVVRHGSGDAEAGLERLDDSPDPGVGDNQPVIPGLEGLNLHHVSYSRSGPVAPPEELREYEDILPGAADRILRMAEATLDAENQAKLVPLKAEAWAVKFATTGVTLLPYACIGGVVLALANGNDSAALAAGLAAALAAGPQVIAATRRRS